MQTFSRFSALQLDIVRLEDRGVLWLCLFLKALGLRILLRATVASVAHVALNTVLGAAQGFTKISKIHLWRLD